MNNEHKHPATAELIKAANYATDQFNAEREAMEAAKQHNDRLTYEKHAHRADAFVSMRTAIIAQIDGLEGEAVQ